MTASKGITVGALVLGAGLIMAAGGKGDILTGIAQVYDGDGIYLQGRKTRIFGIDAPEWNQPCKDGSPCGAYATAYLKGLVEGKIISCVIEGHDRYKRALVTCFTDGKDVARTMVKAGWAMAYRRYSKRYLADESAGFRFGEPWEWRRKNKKR